LASLSTGTSSTGLTTGGIRSAFETGAVRRAAPSGVSHRQLGSIAGAVAGDVLNAAAGGAFSPDSQVDVVS
jgi:hypothetical protein